MRGQIGDGGDAGGKEGTSYELDFGTVPRCVGEDYKSIFLTDSCVYWHPIFMMLRTRTIKLNTTACDHALKESQIATDNGPVDSTPVLTLAPKSIICLLVAPYVAV